MQHTKFLDRANEYSETTSRFNVTPVPDASDLPCFAWEERNRIKSKEIQSQLARVKIMGTE